MPVRSATVRYLAEKIRGVHVFNGLTGESETITDTELAHTTAVAESVFLSVVQHVDWKRVLLEAHILHMRLDHADFEKVCAECVRAALLTDDRSWLPRHDHTQDDFVMPDPYETPPVADWPAGVAEAVKYRRPTATKPPATRKVSATKSSVTRKVRS